MHVYVSRINALGMDEAEQNENICIYWIKFLCKLTLSGKNSSKGGGKTPFCDMTGEFEVDVDLNGDGIIDATLDEQDQYLFSNRLCRCS